MSIHEDSGRARDTLTDLLQARARAAAIADAALLDAVVAVADRDPLGFDTDLVAFTLAWTQTTARAQVEFGRYLQQVIKPAWTALCAGDLDLPRARVFHDVLALVDDNIAFTIALDLVERAGGWTTGQLRDRLRRAVLRADPDGAAQRTARTVAGRRVVVAPEGNGTAGLFASGLPAARAVAAYERVDAYARARHAGGDARTLDQLRADTFLDLLDGIAMNQPPIHRRGIVEITIPWTTLTRGSNPTGINPSDVDPAGGGQHSRPMSGTTDEAAAVGGAGNTDRGGSGFALVAPDDAGRGGPAGDAPTDGDEPATLAGFGPLDAHAARDVVETMLGRDDVAWRLRIDSDTGQLWQLRPLSPPPDMDTLTDTLTDIATATQLDGAQPPREADPRRRAPGPALARWIRARDGTCRAPGCRAPASVCDIDHTIAYADGGLTTHDNLANACRHHHRLKHEAGWQVTQPTPGVLTWRSPHGDRFTRTYIT